MYKFYRLENAGHSVYQIIKFIHISCVVLSVSGFFMRGLWLLQQSPRLQNVWVRRLPHWIDAVLFSSGILMAWQAGFFVAEINWLSIKLLLVLAYILLGMAALHWFKRRLFKMLSWLLALVVAGFIISIALSKSPYGLFAYLLAGI